MQPLCRLLGADHPAGTRVADSQTCLRVQDIGEVGDNRHTTFFEMLGNWSLGDYFKQEQLPQVWFSPEGGARPQADLRLVLHQDPAHGIPKDTESAEIWTRLFTESGVSADQAEVDTESTPPRWAPTAESLLRRRTVSRRRRRSCRSASQADRQRAVLPLPRDRARPGLGANCHQNCDCSRFLEIGNSVFMGTNDRDRPRRSPARTSTTAVALLIAAASIDTSDVFKINLLWPIIEKLQTSAKTYEDETVAMRVIADHLRGATFLAVDGVRPSNKAQGYVMRRLIRRAVRYAFDPG
jgi:alanyl-tRNA synthetase